MAVDFLYHYTGRSFIDDILEDCTLWPSHAAWGFGVYLTDIPPRDDTRQRISTVFGRRRFYAERLEAYVRIERDKADADQHTGDPHIFIAAGKVSLAGASSRSVSGKAAPIKGTPPAGAQQSSPGALPTSRRCVRRSSCCGLVR